MFTSGSAAPSATTGDTHIAHSLTVTGRYMAAPCQQEGGGRAGKQRRGGPQRYRNKNKIRDDDSEDETKQRKSFGLEMGKDEEVE